MSLTVPNTKKETEREKIIKSLIKKGLLKMEDIVFNPPPRAQITPIKVKGKPLSQEIIEMRSEGR
jgi:hypothetical protein